MIKQRVLETNEGIQDELEVEVFNEFEKTMRDKGWNNVDGFIAAGIEKGTVLEIGPGPGLIGLEWLKKTHNEGLTALEISDAMICIAKKNAADYGFSDKVRYVKGNALEMPFENESFDAVFSNGSMHEWEKPVKVFNEIYRVLRPGGIFCISDLRRDVSPLIVKMIYASTKPREIRPGFLTSLHAAYTVNELTELLRNSEFGDFKVEKEFFGLKVTGKR
jgi:ubiquinone/menaquinone biosynthesis C-methylase UbiE